VYWAAVTSTLKSLGTLKQPLRMLVEQSVVGQTEGLRPTEKAAADLPFEVGHTGNKDIADLPNTFGGFFQAWVRLRNLYAPKMLLGMSVDAFGLGPSGATLFSSDGPRPPSGQIDQMTGSFGRFY